MKRSSEEYERMAKSLAAALESKTKDELVILATNAMIQLEVMEGLIETDVSEIYLQAIDRAHADRLEDMRKALSALKFNWSVIADLQDDLKQQPSRLASRGGVGKSQKQSEADRRVFAFLDQHQHQAPKHLRGLLRHAATFDMTDDDAKNAVRRWRRARKEQSSAGSGQED